MAVSSVGLALTGAAKNIFSAFGKIKKRREQQNTELQKLKPVFEGIQLRTTNPDSPSTGKGFGASRLLDSVKELFKPFFEATNEEGQKQKLSNFEAMAAEWEPKVTEEDKETDTPNLMALLRSRLDEPEEETDKSKKKK